MPDLSPRCEPNRSVGELETHDAAHQAGEEEAALDLGAGDRSSSRTRPTDSSPVTIPTTTGSEAPMPTHTAYAVPTGSDRMA